MKIIPYSFIGHVIDSEQIPGIISDAGVIFGEVGVRPGVKEFCIGYCVLLGSASTLTEGKNF